MKIFIFGANGMLGSYLANFFSNANAVPITRQDIDITKVNARSISSFLRNRGLESGDVVINAAGIIKQRKSTPEEMFLVNAVFPKYLSDICTRLGARNIHISTDCVFSGLDSSVYMESDYPTPNDYYGFTKYAGEQHNVTLIRTSIIGEDKTGLSLLGWARQNAGKEIDGYVNHYWNGLTCLELCKYIDCLLIKNKLFTGLQHVATSTKISKYELLKIYNEVFDLGLIIKPVRTTYTCDRSLWSMKENTYDNIVYIKNNYHQQIKELKDAKNIYSDFGHRGFQFSIFN